MYPKKFWNEFRLSKWSDSVFVGMWFENNNVEQRFSDIIEKAIVRTNLKPYFLRNLITGDSIPIDIMTGIVECKLVLFDISPMDNSLNRNPNVMYELGLAQAWRNKEEVIVMRDDNNDLPFNIQSLGVVQYNKIDKEKAIGKIEQVINFRLQEIEKIQKSMVRKAAESLTMEAHSVLMSSQGKIFVIPEADVKQYMLSIPLLLNLGLIEMLTDIKGYGYHPTQLGREVIRYYNMPLGDDDLRQKYPSLYREEYENQLGD